MSIEIILHQDKLFSFGKLLISYVFEKVRVINGCPPLGHGDMAPTFEGRKGHEQIVDAVALIFIIGADHVPGLHRDWGAGFGPQLL